MSHHHKQQSKKEENFIIEEEVIIKESADDARDDESSESDYRERAFSHDADAGDDEVDEDEAQVKKGDIRISKRAILTILTIVLVIMLGYNFRGLVIAATVNGHPISRWSVVSALEKASGKQALDSLIIQQVIADEVKKQGIVIAPADLTAAQKRIEDQVATQGQTLDSILASQGMSKEMFIKQITTQLQIEKLLGDKITVTPQDIDAYIATNKLKIPAEQLDAARKQIGEQLKNDKMSKEAQAYVEGLRAGANISIIAKY
jgi:parvulin-like peptidyl-prolyl isomerase